MALTALLGSGVATSVVLMQDATADPRRPGRCWKQAVLGLVVCAVLQALAPPVRAGRLPRYGGNIRVELGMLPANLDPASLIGEDGRLVASCLYEGLTRWGAAGLEPAIARGWVQSDDARRWVFHLRTDAEFHDGSPCDAEAISASFHHLADPRESRFAWILQDLEGWADFASGRTQVLEGVYVVSPSEIELQFTRPVPDLPARLAMPAASIVRWLGLLPIGTGPFRAVNVAPGTLRLVAFESYHEGRPFFDGIDFVTDADLELTPWGRDAVMQRENAAATLPAGAVQIRVPALRLGLALIHPQSRVLSTLSARHQLAEGFDRAVFVRATLSGDGEAASGLVPGAPNVVRSRMEGREGDLLHRPRQRVRIVVAQPEPVLRKLGERLQVHLFALGLDAEFDVLQPNDFERALFEGPYDIVLLGWTPAQPRGGNIEEATRVRHILDSLLEPILGDQLPESWRDIVEGREAASESQLLESGHLIPLIFFHETWQVSDNLVGVRPGRITTDLGVSAAHLEPGIP